MIEVNEWDGQGTRNFAMKGHVTNTTNHNVVYLFDSPPEDNDLCLSRTRLFEWRGRGVTILRD